MVYIADGTEFKALEGTGPNFFNEITGTGSTEIGAMNTNREYIINIPGLTPQFMNSAALGGYQS